MKWITLLIPLLFWGCTTDEPDPGYLTDGKEEPEYAYVVIKNEDSETALRVFGEEYVAPGNNSKPYEVLKGHDYKIWYYWDDAYGEKIQTTIPWSDLSVGKTKTITAKK